MIAFRVSASLVLCSFLSLAVSCNSNHPTIVSREEKKLQKEWVRNHLSGKDATPPFSFKCGDASSPVFLEGCTKKLTKRRLDKDKISLTEVWTDGNTGLQVRNEAVVYNDFPVVEWTLYIKNTSDTDSPSISELNGLDIKLYTDDRFIPLLHGRHGDYEKAECFGPFIDTLSAGNLTVFAPPGYGKSTDGPRGWPYHNLQISENQGYIIVLGWPGQWEDRFSCSEGTISASGGQQTFSSWLKPGEEIRTPLNLIMFWKGKDVTESQNMWRRFYLAHVIPHFDGKPQQPAYEIQCSPAKGSIAYLKKYIDKGMKPDISWQDANWYPSADGPYGPHGWKDDRIPSWIDPTKFDPWLNTGTWEIDTVKFPEGFRDFSAFARDNGVQFLVWFEPERVGNPDSWLGKNHPEWLLPNPIGDILNEGDPEARMWLTDHIDTFIKENGLVWYREDMNGPGPGEAWKRNDPEGRSGITENLYVQGHLAYWDSLKARNPGLHIDACASGGRRNDLETMRRAVPLLRSDFQWPHMENLLRGNQGHTYGLSSWLPYQGSATYDTTMYAARSFYLPLFGTVGIKEADEKFLKQAYDEHREVAGYMLMGDYYPLTPYDIGPDEWMAWQFNRPEEGKGIVQAFRREGCERTITLKLRGLDPRAEYVFSDFDDPEAQLLASGRTLMDSGLTITARSCPEARIYSYARKSRD